MTTERERREGYYSRLNNSHKFNCNRNTNNSGGIISNIVIICLMLGGAYHLAVASQQASTSSVTPEQTSNSTATRLTLSNYNKIEKGMTPSEVGIILGNPDDHSYSSFNEINFLEFKYYDKSSKGHIFITFVEDSASLKYGVSSKYQSNLD